MSRIYFIVFLLVIYLLLDWYIFQALKLVLSDKSIQVRRIVAVLYFAVSILLFFGIVMYNQLEEFQQLRLFLTSGFLIFFLAKVFASLFLFIDDARRVLSYIWSLIPFREEEAYSPSRSAFMARAAIAAGAIPIASFSFGILSGAHDYRVRKRTIAFESLPRPFDGMRIVQISDIHTGSFFNKTAVSGGVDLINQQKPDMVLFTGDLVNNQSEEAKPYLDIFKKIRADLGVFSTMGNHDYGDYMSWPSIQAKRQDIRQLHEMHRYMGWDILLNENRILREGGEQIAILGVENWGSGRFSKYGDLEQTCQGTEEVPFKLLLSHDPSHWDAQVRPHFPDIDLQLAGHTHGMQFGIEIGNFRWSPSQYIYKQWADLYQQGKQYIYVNRGFGYIGYPGRIGILPEITVLELKRA